MMYFHSCFNIIGYNFSLVLSTILTTNGILKLMKKLFLVYAWLLLSTGIILTSIATWHFWHLAQATISTPEESQTVALANSNEPTQAEPEDGEVQGVETIVETADARAVIVAKFLERYRSPLKPYDYYGKKLVEIADQYDLDFRLLPAIAMKESGLCKNIPADSYNCLGWGITATNTLRFDSYEDSFTSAAKGLRSKYLDHGRITVEDLAPKYNPVTPEQWASGVNQFMTEMRYDDRQLGKERKANADLLEFIDQKPAASNSSQTQD
ncbi:MAG: hypothetical protein GF390_01810 [Candidatus Pacebacteria bacterium]|nr:hypothetical protein [Candidatus Paceibacterota bacterium]